MAQFDRAVHILQTIPQEPVMEFSLKPFKDSKSLAQLRTVHGWIREIQEAFQESQGKFYTIESLKEWLKGLFGVTELLDMPDGTQRLVYKSFADYKMQEMSTLMEKMEHYCGSELRIFLTIPNSPEE
jgi:hypothetical protein